MTTPIHLSFYDKIYKDYLQEIIRLFKEKIMEETGPILFTSLQDIFNTDPKAKEIQKYLIECAKEHCPDMDPLFVDMFLSIYYNTNEPIDGNLLRMMLYYPKAKDTDWKYCSGITKVGGSMHCGATDLCIPSMEIVSSVTCCSCILCYQNIELLKHGKENIDYYKAKVVLSGNITNTGLINTCNKKYIKSNTNSIGYNNFDATMYVVRPEYIKFMLNNFETLFTDIKIKQTNGLQSMIYNSHLYIEYYKYLENCMHPDKLGTVNFIVIPIDDKPKEELQESIKELTKKVDELMIKLDNNIISDNRFKYILSLIK